MDLFEDIRKGIGCSYVSDIRYEPFRMAAICFSSHLCLKKYDRAQWKDFAEYMFSENKNFRNALDIALYLQKKRKLYLNQKRQRYSTGSVTTHK